MVFCTDFRFIKALFLTLLLCHSNSEATEGTQMGTGKLAGMMSGAVALGLFAKPAFNYIQQRNFYEIGSKFSYAYVGIYTMIRGVSPEAKRAADQAHLHQESINQTRAQGEEIAQGLQRRIDELTGQMAQRNARIAELEASLRGDTQVADLQGKLLQAKMQQKAQERYAELEKEKAILIFQLEQRNKELHEAKALNESLAQENALLRNIVEGQKTHLQHGALLFERMRQYVPRERMKEDGDDCLNTLLTNWTRSEVMNLSAASVSARVLYPQRPQIVSSGFPAFGGRR